MVTRIYRNPNKHFTHEGKPLLLFVTMEKTECGLHVKIKGFLNPLPFKEATIHKTGKELCAWLIDQGWIEVGHFYK